MLSTYDSYNSSILRLSYDHYSAQFHMISVTTRQVISSSGAQLVEDEESVKQQPRGLHHVGRETIRNWRSP